MARAIEQSWPGTIDAGLVVTRYGHGVACNAIEVVEAAHPVPDEVGCEAARRILDLASDLGEGDLAIVLVSGGASALLAMPGGTLNLSDKQDINRALLLSGADIHEMNCVRKHLSAIKGGGLALAAWPARAVTLAISDVPGDDPAVIGSGPTVPDPTTLADAQAILEKYDIALPEGVARHLATAESETPKPGDTRFADAEYRMVATPQDSLEAAADVARKAGVTPVILGDAIEGEARTVARKMAEIALRAARKNEPTAPPVVLLSGGETTVAVRGSGRGGRNSEFLLALALALDGAAGIHALAADTDGIDGVEDNAGAIIRPDTLMRARAAGIDPADRLGDNDGYGFFEALGDLVITGPTLTNVNDFRAILVLQQA